jgi:hypothetical protein
MEAYATNMVSDFVQEFGSIRDFNTPGPTGAPPTRSSTEDTIIEMEKFRSFVGRLMFAAGKTEPTICNACRELSSHLTAPNAEHWKRLSHLMGYAQTKTLLGYKLRPPRDRRVIAFVDSDYASDKDDRKSISGYFVTVGGCLVSWGSKKQSGVTLSSTEAEFVAMSIAATEIKFVVSLLTEIGGEPPSLPSILREDNTGAIFMAKNTAIGQRTKHVDIRYRFVNDMVQQGDLSVVHISGDENPSDVMTKNLPYALHAKHNSTIVNGTLGKFYDPRNTEDVKPSRATVVSADTTSRVVRPLPTTVKGQTNDTGTICSAVSQINACENGWTLVKSKSQKVNSNTTGID